MVETTCMQTFEVKKEKKVQQIKREGSIKGKRGLYKKQKIPSPSKVAKEWLNIPLGGSVYVNQDRKLPKTGVGVKCFGCAQKGCVSWSECT